MTRLAGLPAAPAELFPYTVSAANGSPVPRLPAAKNPGISKSSTE